MKQQEHFPIDEDLVKEFVKINKQQWKEVKHTDKYIYINLSMVRMQVPWIIPKLIYAKGLEEVTGATPIVITWNENKILTELFHSFGIQHLVLDNLIKKDIVAFIKSMGKTGEIFLKGGTGEAIKKLKILGFNVGKQIYEDILRTSSYSTIKSAYKVTCIKKCLHILWAAYALHNYCTKKRPLIGVMDDVAYHEGVFIKVLKRNNAEMLACSNVGDNIIRLDEEYNIERAVARTKRRIKEQLVNVGEESIYWTEKYLEEKFQGKIGKELDRGAFTGKKVFTREELQKKLGLDDKKKNVVIMAHTFTDAVFNYGNYYYRDYYDWTEKTLKIASKVKDVNWILKPHPTRAAYNESKDSIENMFKKYKKENMFMLSDEISAESIRYLADVLITLGGSAGGEFSCFGIPAVIVGIPFYSELGYTIEPKTKKEYKNCLKNISKISKLNEEQTRKAKKVFYLNYCHEIIRTEESCKYTDDFSIVVNEKYKNMISKMAISYFKSNDKTEIYNNESLSDIIEYTKAFDLKESSYYKQGKKRGKSII